MATMLRPLAIGLLLAALLGACAASGSDETGGSAGAGGRVEPSAPPADDANAVATICADLGAIMADPDGMADGTTTGLVRMLEQVRREDVAALEDAPELAADLDAAIDAFQSHDLTDDGSIDGFGRLLAACSEESTSTSVTSPTTTTTTASQTPRPDAAERLQFRPVLAVETSPCDLDDSSATCSVPTTSPLPAGAIQAPSVDGSLVYVLGPAGFDGSSLASAHAERHEAWAVDVRVRKADVATANDLFNRCYDGDATCPSMSGDGRGAIAIVFDGAVVSAPAVNGPDLADDAFTISGDFTRSEAEHLADSLFG